MYAHIHMCVCINTYMHFSNHSAALYCGVVFLYQQHYENKLMLIIANDYLLSSFTNFRSHNRQLIAYYALISPPPLDVSFPLIA